jgi:hypothetical protein
LRKISSFVRDDERGDFHFFMTNRKVLDYIKITKPFFYYAIDDLSRKEFCGTWFYLATNNTYNFLYSAGSPVHAFGWLIDKENVRLFKLC